jgi:hypothetical protein
MGNERLIVRIMKNPLIIIGLILCYLLYSYMVRNGIWDQHRDSLNATSCKSVLVKLKKNAPKNWQVFCEQKSLTLAVEVNSEVDQIPASPPSTADSKTIPKALEGENLKKALYRELANIMIDIAKLSSHVGLDKDDPLKEKIKAGDRALMGIKSSRNGVQEIAENESLIRTGVVRIKLIHSKLVINAIASGANISKLCLMEDTKFIADHIAKTVRVQEVPTGE